MSTRSTGEQADLEIYWRYELWVRRRHSGIFSACNTTGCIYAMRRSLARPVAPDSLTDDLVLPLGALLNGYRIVVEPEALAFDYPHIEGGEFQRKLRTLAGLWQAHLRYPRLLTRSNPMRLHFLSHKSARLVLPWAILLAWGATLALPASPLRDFLLVDEAMLPLLALCDRFVPAGIPLKRITSPARSFMGMNFAALLAVAVFFVPPEKFWRPTRIAARGEPKAKSAASGR
jgi:hypothetical protein